MPEVLRGSAKLYLQPALSFSEIRRRDLATYPSAARLQLALLQLCFHLVSNDAQQTLGTIVVQGIIQVGYNITTMFYL